MVERTTKFLRRFTVFVSLINAFGSFLYLDMVLVSSRFNLLWLPLIGTGIIGLLGLMSCIPPLTKFFRNFQSWLLNINLMSASPYIFFCLIDIAIHTIPNTLSLIPPTLLTYYSKDDVELARKELVEQLERSPYVIFKPQTMITSQGFRGPESEFTYSWKTDEWGFKNPPGLTQTNVDVVVLGDSFAEGMGVPTEHTFPSLLTKKGFKSYNLGVQGYAPTQMAGSYFRYGVRLKPKAVVVAYFTTTFDRENAIVQRENGHDVAFDGAVQKSIELTREVRSLQTRLIGPALLMSGSTLVRHTLKNLLSPNPEITTVPTVVTEQILKYKSEIDGFFDSSGMKLKIAAIRNKEKAWQRTLKAFDSIFVEAKKRQQKVYVMHIPDRGYIYYSALYGKKVPIENIFDTELTALTEFCRQRGVSLINPAPALQRHVAKVLAEGLDASKLPYLKIDGHINKVGYEILANELASAMSHE